MYFLLCPATEIRHKHIFRSVLFIFILLAVTRSSTVYIRIVALTLQQWLPERGTVLLYTYIVFLIFIFSYSPNKSCFLSRGGRRMNDED